MALDKKKLEKPLLKLRKLLRKASKVPTPDEVHDVRTNTRRVEAAVEALQLGQRRKGRRLLRVTTPIRKRAGDVRDMDVLTGFSVTLSSNGDDPCLIKLLEHLGEKRARGARKLRKTITKHRSLANRLLKGYALFIERNFEKHNSRTRTEWRVDATAVVLRIAGELRSWPRLSAKNLHAFRLKVKEMRYVLQFSGQDSVLTEQLGEVKDQIGEWHDWTELHAIAKRVLSDTKNCAVISRIQETVKQKFENALRTAQRLRRNCFGPQGRRQKSRNKVILKEPVIKATAGLAA